MEFLDSLALALPPVGCGRTVGEGHGRQRRERQARAEEEKKKRPLENVHRLPLFFPLFLRHTLPPFSQSEPGGSAHWRREGVQESARTMIEVGVGDGGLGKRRGERGCKRVTATFAAESSLVSTATFLLRPFPRVQRACGSAAAAAAPQRRQGAMRTAHGGEAPRAGGREEEKERRRRGATGVGAAVASTAVAGNV